MPGLQVVGEPSLDLGAAFRAHSEFLARCVGRLLGPGAAVEDVVQQCFLIAWERRERLTESEALRGWLYRTCVHLVAHERRSFARRRRLSDAFAVNPRSGAQAADDAVDGRQRALQVGAVVAEMPLKLREVFVLYEMEGLTAPQIASLTGLSQGTVWRRSHFARAHFERAWRGGAHGGA